MEVPQMTKGVPIVIDIIILSYAQNDQLKRLTENTVETCIKSEDPDKIAFNIVVIESNEDLNGFQYLGTTTIYPSVEFGFHRYLNIGIRATQSNYICFCNNDLIFHENWASKLISALGEEDDLVSASTFCPNFHDEFASRLNNEINYGYENGIHFTGWCFMVKRTVFNIVGMFDEHFEFWYSDDDFRLTLQKHKLKNALVSSSKVTHLKSETLDHSLTRRKIYLKYCGFAYYKYKWQHQNFLLYLFENLKYRLKILFA